MQVLTDDDIKAWNARHDWSDEVAAARDIEAVILAKFANAKLPKPATWGLKDFVTRSEKPLFTADQLNQAYVQGAASQLSAWSVAETTCDCYPDHGGTIYAEAVIPTGTQLYTRKEPN